MLSWSPIQCEYLALEGVSELLDTLMRIRRTLNPSLEIEGILLTMYDERTSLSRQVATDLRSFFGNQIFQSLIPRNVRLAEAPSFGKPIIFYDIHSKGAEGYTQLAQEVIANAEKRLGTGLGALIREPEQHTPAAPPAGSTGTPAPSHSVVAPGGSAAAAAPALSATSAGPLQIDIDLIEPSPIPAPHPISRRSSG